METTAPTPGIGSSMSLQEFPSMKKKYWKPENHLKALFFEEQRKKNPKLSHLEQKVDSLQKERERGSLNIVEKWQLGKKERKLRKLESKLSSVNLNDSIGSPKPIAKEHHKIESTAEIQLMQKGSVSLHLHEDKKKEYKTATQLARYIWNNKGELFVHLLEQVPQTPLAVGTSVGDSPDVFLYNNYGVTPDEKTLAASDHQITFKFHGKEYTIPRGEIFIENGQIFLQKKLEINCDVAKVLYDKNGACIWAFADGCNWGEDPRLSATRATDVATEYVQGYLANREITNLRSLVKAQINALLEAQDVHRKENLQGTTTLIVATVIDGYLVCTHVGDCSVIVFKSSNQLPINLTSSNRQNTEDASDPHGRIGLYTPLDDNQTEFGGDFRNCGVSIYKLEKGDVVATVSDGITDCCDPIMRGKTPYNYGALQQKEWDFEISEHRQIREEETLRYLHTITGGKAYNGKEWGSNVIKAIAQLTFSSQMHLLTKPGALPKDTVQYPGKLDHAGSVWFQYKPSFVKKRSVSY